MFPFTPYITLLGWYHLVIYGLFVPLLSVRSYVRLRSGSHGLPQRIRHFRSTAVMLVLFTSLSLLVTLRQPLELFPAFEARPGGRAAGALMYVVCVLGMRPRWRRAVEQRKPIVSLFMPANGAERAWWVVVSLLAGIGEEITWRGVQPALLAALTGNWWLAAALSALSFGAAHAVQGWKSALVIGVFALGFHALVFLTGSLYVAMAVHVAYDITAGLTYGKLARELGYELPQPAAT